MVEKELSRGDDLSIISLVSALIEHAHLSRVSDVHIDPSKDKVRIRIRVDGVLQESFFFLKAIHSEVISRIKVLAGLRTDEHQATQDGRFRHTIKEGNAQVDVRVSIVPTYHGENAVLRLPHLRISA